MPDSNNDMNQMPPAPGSHLPTAKAVLVLFVLLLAIGFIYAYQTIRHSAPQQGPVVTEDTTTMFQTIDNTLANILTAEEGDPDIVHALNVFREIAMDEKNAPTDRARALNLINYTYTASDYDAKDVYDVIFSRPPYSQYYEAHPTESADIIHPASSGSPEAVEEALQKLNELSLSLTPTHYAIARLQIAQIFAFTRDSAKTGADVEALKTKYVGKIKELDQAYNALPAITTPEYSKLYRKPLLLQVLFVHANALGFIGNITGDKTYLDKGEAEFKSVINLATEYSDGPDGTDAVKDQQLLARIFYVSLYWRHYKATNPDYMMQVIEPLFSDWAKATNVYVKYLPVHKESKVPPYSVLRDMAKQYPDLKTFLEGRGWKF